MQISFVSKVHGIKEALQFSEISHHIICTIIICLTMTVICLLSTRILSTIMALKDLRYLPTRYFIS